MGDPDQLYFDIFRVEGAYSETMSAFSLPLAMELLHTPHCNMHTPHSYVLLVAQLNNEIASSRTSLTLCLAHTSCSDHEAVRAVKESFLTGCT